MKKVFMVACGICALIGLTLGSSTYGNGAVDGDEPGMMVSPHTIVLSKISGVTVHTNVPAAVVNYGTVTLDGVEALFVWADDRGHLAARFAVADLDLEPADAVTLTLSANYKISGGFTATDVVRVK